MFIGHKKQVSLHAVKKWKASKENDIGVWNLTQKEGKDKANILYEYAN